MVVSQLTEHFGRGPASLQVARHTAPGGPGPACAELLRAEEEGEKREEGDEGMKNRR